jgi:hypothetical protein
MCGVSNIVCEVFLCLILPPFYASVLIHSFECLCGFIVSQLQRFFISVMVSAIFFLISSQVLLCLFFYIYKITKLNSKHQERSPFIFLILQ